MTAAWENSIEEVKRLIEQGADVSKKAVERLKSRKIGGMYA